jgi:hypothetical protein
MDETHSAAGTGVGLLVSSGADAAADAIDLGGLRRVDADAYELGAELARGGMGRILGARDRRHGRQVAIKVLLSPRADATRRFLREAALTARLSHPGIIPLYEAGRLPSGEPFYAMKLVAGRSLGEAVAQAPALSDRLALLPHVVALCDAVAYAHGQAIIHRDLKPANVLVGKFGETVIIDWGCAKEVGDDRADGGLTVDAGDGTLTLAGHALGTPVYMPPEQARGLDVTPAADVYSIGALLYHVCAGRPPYAGTKGKEALARVLAGPPEPLGRVVPGIAPDLLAIVTQAMAREPSARYPGAAALADDLRRYVAGELVSAHRYSLPTLVGRFVARHRVPVAMGAALVLAVGVTAGLSVRRIVRERDRAETLGRQAEAARAAAVTQRDAAERLVAFAIGTLRERLEGLGKLDLLAGIGGEVLAYYRTLAPVAEADAGALVRRGTALAALAGVEGDRRKHADAEALARAAVEAFEAAAGRDPEDAEAALHRVRARAELAATLLRAAQPASALVEAEHADALGCALVAAAPRDPRAWIAAAYARAVFANVRDAQGDVAGAGSLGARARAWLARVATDGLGAEWHDRLAATYGNLGNLAVDTDKRAAAAAYRAYIALRRQRLAEQPDHAGRLDMLAYGLQQLAQAEDGPNDAIVAAYREAIAIRRQLIQREPQNLQWQWRHVLALTNACNFEGRWRLADAAADCAEARAVAEHIAAERPGDPPAQLALARVLRVVGRQQHAAHQGELAAASLRAAIAIDRREAARAPGGSAGRNALGPDLRVLGRVELALGHLEAARTAIEEAVAVQQQLLADAPGQDLYEASLGDAYLVLGDLEWARGGAAAARAAYTRAVAALGRAVAGARDDFALILAEACLKLAAAEPDASARAALRARAALLESAGMGPPETQARLEAAGRRARGR